MIISKSTTLEKYTPLEKRTSYDFSIILDSDQLVGRANLINEVSMRDVYVDTGQTWIPSI